MAGPPGGIEARRTFVLTALNGAAALALGTRATAQPKMTKAQAQYQAVSR